LRARRQSDGLRCPDCSLGFDAWVELRLGSGETLWAQLPRTEIDRLAVAPGMTVGADLTQRVRFAAA
jgi:hypothetical protein